ncbi:MAG: hypothetical protein ACTHN5_00420 [Phycisphaerae bacterium]
MKEDPIITELRSIRRELLNRAGGDVKKVLERADREASPLLAKHRRKPGAVSKKA